MKIVNMKRFIISTSVTLLLILFIFSIILNFVIKNFETSLKGYKNITIVVKAGDTLWDISEKYNDGNFKNNDLVNYIRSINSIGNKDKIITGQEILVPIKENIKNQRMVSIE